MRCSKVESLESDFVFFGSKGGVLKMRKIGLLFVLGMIVMFLSSANAATWTERTVIREVSRTSVSGCSGATRVAACSGSARVVRAASCSKPQRAKASCSKPQRAAANCSAARVQAVRVVRVRSRCPNGICP